MLRFSFLVGMLAFAGIGPISESYGAPYQAPTAARPVALGSLLAEFTKSSGVYAVAMPFLMTEPVLRPAEKVTEQNIEPVLKALVKKLPLPSRLIKLYLPKPPAGRNWSAEELMAVASAQAKLFRKPIGDSKSEVVEILAQPYSHEQAKPAIEALDLRPVYVITLQNGFFGGVWESTFGELRLEQRGTRVVGTYTSNGGQIEGDVLGNDLRFWWYESSGSLGYGVFQMAEDGLSFSGPWFSGAETLKPSGTWTGRRMGRG